jgi:hypothetical protein
MIIENIATAKTSIDARPNSGTVFGPTTTSVEC